MGRSVAPARRAGVPARQSGADPRRRHPGPARDPGPGRPRRGAGGAVWRLRRGHGRPPCRERGAQGRRAGTAGRRPAPGRPAAGDPRRAHRRAVRQAAFQAARAGRRADPAGLSRRHGQRPRGPCRAAPGRSAADPQGLRGGAQHHGRERGAQGHDHHAENVARKAAVLELLAGALRLAGRRPVIRVGRIAGQYAKPRSKPHEQVGEQTLPVYRGDMVNGREAHAEQRRADPQRILKGYAAARNIMRHLGWDAASGQEANASPVWTSHEMLLLDYELSMLREDEQRRVYLGSTHWPWIGERTRQVDGAHVALLAEVLNPVACKVGPEIGRDQLLALCERLDPRREPGRLTLIARMGAQKVGERLPPLVEAVRAAGHPVIWLSDPMHGNTIVAPCGNKTRLVRSIAEEVAAFRLAVSGSGGVAAGLHLETTPDDVTECVADSSGLHQVSRHYTSLCDPRLNPWQALSAVMAWSGAEAIPSATFPLETVA
ncbi:phospho-2-dehydro-3-deoxyheptonate aldolase [Pseudomonas aeruginosa]|nr:phospho-2-dehydro-3-deoxyheptonate aldolase [Pseudomonas aeruginosa]